MVLRNIMQQCASAAGGSAAVADGVDGDCRYLVAPRIAHRADHIVVARALALTEETGLQVTISLIDPANLDDWLRSAGGHEYFDDNFGALNDRSPQATFLAPVAGGIGTLDVRVFRVVDPQLRPLGHLVSGET